MTDQVQCQGESMMDRLLRAVETDVITEVQVAQFPEVPQHSAVVHHLWKGLPAFWDGNFETVRLQMVTPGYAARAFEAFAKDGNCLNANALPLLLRNELPESFNNKMIILAGTLFADLRSSQTYVLGISTIRRPTLYKLLASAMVAERTYALVFKM